MNLETIKRKSLENSIPIVRDRTITCLIDLIKKNKFESILEIGTAYGYSAKCFSDIDCVKKVITLEKQYSNFLVAKNNLKDDKKITCLNVDAFDFTTKDNYDLIFFDGGKSHQEILFEKFSNFLNKNGIIFIDNIYLKKFRNKTNLSKNQIKLLNKLDYFHKWLLSLPDWNIKIFDIDDGYAICKRKQTKINGIC